MPFNLGRNVVEEIEAELNISLDSLIVTIKVLIL